MKIVNKISIAFLLTAIFLSVSAVIIIYIITRNLIIKNIYDHLKTTTSSRANHIDTYLKMQRIYVEQLSQEILFEDLLTVADTNEEKKLIVKLSSNTLVKVKSYSNDIREIMILNKENQVILSSDKEDIDEEIKKNPVHVKMKDESYIGDIYYNHLTQQHEFAVVAPIKSKITSELLGYVAVRVSMDSLNRITSDYIGLGNTGESYLVNRNGYIITPSRFINNAVLTVNIDSERLKFNITDKKYQHEDVDNISLVYNDYRDVEVIGLHEDLIMKDWFLVTEIDAKEVFVPLTKLKIMLGSIIVIVSITAWCIGLVVGRAIIKPIDELKEGCRSIGEGKLHYKMDISKKDEIGELAKEFMKMANNLRKITASRDDYLKEIDARIYVENELKISNEDLMLNQTQLKYLVRDYRKINKKLEEAHNQILQAEKMAAVGQLSSGVAHEIKNPLTVILLSIESLYESFDVNDDELNRRLSMIKESAERANHVVKAMLNYSRYSSVSFQIVNIFDIIDLSISLSKNSSKIKNVEYVREYDKSINAEIVGDPVLLGQVFLNIFLNAIDAVEENGKINIKVYSSKSGLGGGIIISEISDNGIGMIDEIRNQIFNPFFTTKEQGKGTGLGLSTVYMIIQKHNGDISVESEVGKGTKFIIELPVNKDEKIS